MVKGVKEKHLEHLNESNAKIEVRLIAADQAGTVEETYGDYGPEIDSASHLHFITAIEEGGGPGEDLGHHCGEEEMPTC